MESRAASYQGTHIRVIELPGTEDRLFQTQLLGRSLEHLSFERSRGMGGGEEKGGREGEGRRYTAGNGRIEEMREKERGDEREGGGVEK